VVVIVIAFEAVKQRLQLPGRLEIYHFAGKRPINGSTNDDSEVDCCVQQRQVSVNGVHGMKMLRTLVVVALTSQFLVEILG
jgi:hypothetical protein